MPTLCAPVCARIPPICSCIPICPRLPLLPVCPTCYFLSICPHVSPHAPVCPVCRAPGPAPCPALYNVPHSGSPRSPPSTSRACPPHLCPADPVCVCPSMHPCVCRVPTICSHTPFLRSQHAPTYPPSSQAFHCHWQWLLRLLVLPSNMHACRLRMVVVQSCLMVAAPVHASCTCASCSTWLRGSVLASLMFALEAGQHALVPASPPSCSICITILLQYTHLCPLQYTHLCPLQYMHLCPLQCVHTCSPTVRACFAPLQCIVTCCSAELPPAACASEEAAKCWSSPSGNLMPSAMIRCGLCH